MCVSRTVESSKQSGAALIAFLLVFVTAASFALLKGLNEVATKQHRDVQTVRALAEAKAALIGYAAGANIIPTGLCGSNCRRPGDLPCPDRDDDGLAGSGTSVPLPPPLCGDASGSTGGCLGLPGNCWRLGRLPWKTLGLPDLRDGNGERLWYAVSNNFKRNTRTSCGFSGAEGCLNSDSRGTVTVSAANGAVIHNGTNPDEWTPSGAVAMLLAPGRVLQRQGARSDQNRTCAGGSCDPNGKCITSPPTSTPKCNPQNYLDVGGGEDNATFGDNTLDGFIQGDIVDTNGQVIVNDTLLAISYQDLIPLMEKRVVGEVLTCLKEYAAPTAPNNGRYPWAAKLDPAAAPNYDDGNGGRFGRLPEVLDDTKTAIGASAWDYWPNKDILSSSNCKLTSNASPNTWWLNWKEIVFYSVAGGFQPAAGPPAYATSSPTFPGVFRPLLRR
ncbi:MAG: hypothetical protein USCGTAYLOR_02748 [Chromatiales bacterium USCg_Taylor]|nr:MAG: hypothetical protein USCGTAYLOR_02748 [Chromatiales bacterium USCg_Taylor]